MNQYNAPPPEGSDSPNYDYDSLLDPGSTELEPDALVVREHIGEPTARQRRIFAPPEGEPEPSADQLGAAAERLSIALSQDEHLQNLFGLFVETDKATMVDMVDALRQEPALRLALGRHFLAKLNAMSHMPERVARNDPRTLKRPNHSGYGQQRFTSHEYVAVLGLAYLDGTFEDRVQGRELPDPEHGQHRFAAEQMLRTYSK